MIKKHKKILLVAAAVLSVAIFAIFMYGYRYGISDPTYTIVRDNLERQYKVHLPANHSGRKMPLVIYLHGGGGDMRAAYMDGLDNMSDKYGFVLAIPQGLGEKKLGHLRGLWNGGKWATGECCGQADDVGFISEMISEIGKNYDIDDRRIYATGISNGALMTNRLGCELADRIAAIAPVASTAVMSDCHPSRPVSIMEIRGLQDPSVPQDGGEPEGIFAKDSGSSFAMPYDRMTPYEVVGAWRKTDLCADDKTDGYNNGGAKCEVYGRCADGAAVELCLVDGMGHTYPAGRQYFSESKIGPVTHDITFDQIWDFFQKHPMR